MVYSRPFTGAAKSFPYSSLQNASSPAIVAKSGRYVHGSSSAPFTTLLSDSVCILLHVSLAKLCSMGSESQAPPLRCVDTRSSIGPIQYTQTCNNGGSTPLLFSPALYSLATGEPFCVIARLDPQIASVRARRHCCNYFAKREVRSVNSNQCLAPYLIDRIAPLTCYYNATTNDQHCCTIAARHCTNNSPGDRLRESMT